jgi:hypothetical protein
MTNPLIDKFYELHPEKKEPPKLPKIRTGTLHKLAHKTSQNPPDAL